MSSLLWTPELKIAHVMGRWHRVWTMSVIDRILVWLLLKLWLMNAKHHSFHPPLSAQWGFLSSGHTDWHVMQGSSSSSEFLVWCGQLLRCIWTIKTKLFVLNVVTGLHFILKNVTAFWKYQAQIFRDLAKQILYTFSFCYILFAFSELGKIRQMSWSITPKPTDP